MRSTGGEYRSTGVLWGKQSLESGVECGKERRFGWRLSHPLHQEGRSGVGGVLFLIPAWEVQLDTLSCMSTSIQSD